MYMFLQAVQQFYQGGSSQQEINKWLMSAQLSNEAWSFSWILLDKGKVMVFFIYLRLLQCTLK